MTDTNPDDLIAGSVSSIEDDQETAFVNHDPLGLNDLDMSTFEVPELRAARSDEATGLCLGDDNGELFQSCAK